VKVTVAAVGRTRRGGPEALLWHEYAKRITGLGRSIGISGFGIVEVPEAAMRGAPERKSREAAALLEKTSGSTVFVLDRSGKSLTSAAFAGRLRDTLESGTGALSLLIGGPDGHGGDVLERADFTLRLGAMTWPHMLARIMLAEQLYRAVTILANHPYHRA